MAPEAELKFLWWAVGCGDFSDQSVVIASLSFITRSYEEEKQISVILLFAILKIC